MRKFRTLVIGIPRSANACGHLVPQSTNRWSSPLTINRFVWYCFFVNALPTPIKKSSRPPLLLKENFLFFNVKIFISSTRYFNPPEADKGLVPRPLRRKIISDRYLVACRGVVHCEHCPKSITLQDPAIEWGNEPTPVIIFYRNL